MLLDNVAVLCVPMGTCKNPASATNNDIASCNTIGYVVFFVLGCGKSALKIRGLI